MYRQDTVQTLDLELHVVVTKPFGRAGRLHTQIRKHSVLSDVSTETEL